MVSKKEPDRPGKHRTAATKAKFEKVIALFRENPHMRIKDLSQKTRVPEGTIGTWLIESGLRRRTIRKGWHSPAKTTPVVENFLELIDQYIAAPNLTEAKRAALDRVMACKNRSAGVVDTYDDDL